MRFDFRTKFQHLFLKKGTSDVVTSQQFDINDPHSSDLNLNLDPTCVSIGLEDTHSFVY